MNTWIGMGRLTRDASVRTYGENNDKKMARLTLAYDRRGRHEEGQQTADFISCVCYGKTADFADKYLRQGTKVVITGSIMTGQYEDKDGRTVYTTDVLVSNIEFAESKKASGEGTTTAPAAVKPSADTSFVNIPNSIVEDEIPFA